MNNRTERAVLVLLCTAYAVSLILGHKPDPGSPKAATHSEEPAKATEEPPPVPEIGFSDFLGAISMVETGNRDDAIGDHGQALGRFQIHKAYWQDAVEFDPSIGGSYEQVTDPAYAKRIVVAYFLRYGKTSLETKNWEALARIHNGGPFILRRKDSSAWKSTTAYWLKIKSVLNDRKHN